MLFYSRSKSFSFLFAYLSKFLLILFFNLEISLLILLYSVCFFNFYLSLISKYTFYKSPSAQDAFPTQVMLAHKSKERIA